MKRGQASMILIIFVIFIILGIGTFLLSFTRSISQSEYLNLYSHNLLLSILRSDTGYNDANCKLVADLISCRFFTSSRTCGDSGLTCETLASETINRYMNSFELVSKNFRYLLIIKKAPGGNVPLGPTGEIIVKIGDLDLETEKITKFTANERIQKVVSLDTCSNLQLSCDGCAAQGYGPDVCDPICEEAANCFAGNHILKAQLILARK